MKVFYSKLTTFFFCLIIAFPIVHFWGDGRMFAKPIFIFTVGLSGLVLLIKRDYFTATTFTSIAILFCVLLLFLQYYFDWGNIFPYIFLLTLFFLYKVFSSFLVKKDIRSKKALIITYIVIISIEIMLVMLSKKVNFLRFYPNESVFSILIAAQLLLIIPFLINYGWHFFTNKYLRKTVPIVFIILCYCILFYTKGRAGILGFTVGILVLNHNQFKSKFVILKAVLIGVCMLFVVLSFKNDSSSGRVLIYKVIVTQLEPKEIITGIGYGKFRTQYNQLQAEYFSKNSINDKEALLADNTYYFYNDPLQLVIETGLIGLFILLFLSIRFFALFRRDYNILNENLLLNGTYLSIICIVVSSLFSYPFQVIGILIHLVLCIAIINSYPKKTLLESFFLQQKNHQILAITTLFVTSICLLFFGFESFKFYKDSNEAIFLSETGFRKKALKKYQDLSTKFIKDGNIMFSYADELCKVNKLDSAIFMLKKSSHYIYNDKNALLMGNLLQEKQFLLEAEKYFKKAVYVNPKLFVNRQVLFKFYYDTKQFDKALYWGNSVITLKAKVPSKTVENIKEETKKLLNEIERQKLK